MGPSAWDELVATEGRIRKQKKEQEYRKAEMQEAIVTWTLSIMNNTNWSSNARFNNIYGGING